MKKVCVNVSGLLCGEVSPGHDEIRAYLSFETPRPCKGHMSKQASGAPF
jgi:hypothetical protein